VSSTEIWEKLKFDPVMFNVLILPIMMGPDPGTTPTIVGAAPQDKI
jgi:hypothetical protein